MWPEFSDALRSRFGFSRKPENLPYRAIEEVIRDLSAQPDVSEDKLEISVSTFANLFEWFGPLHQDPIQAGDQLFETVR
jgi:hypothetical protein